MKKHKLTVRQREVLKVLAGKDMRIGEFFSGWYLWGSRVHQSTAEALYYYGLIEEGKSTDEFRISAKGRQALDEKS